jgi:hypothetical protein
MGCGIGKAVLRGHSSFDELCVVVYMASVPAVFVPVVKLVKGRKCSKLKCDGNWNPMAMY